jgi:hypothetical protein
MAEKGEGDGVVFEMQAIGKEQQKRREKRREGRRGGRERKEYD